MTTGRLSAWRLVDERQLFTLALLLSTWIPMAFFIAVGSFGEPTGRLDTVKIFLLFLGGVHVPVTLVLYMDRKFLPLAAQHKARYVWVPLAVIVASGLVFTLGSRVLQTAVYIVFWAWQTHHYGRQNVGIYSFAGIAGGWRPRPLERRALDFVAASAVCGTFRVLGKDVGPASLQSIFDVLFWLGAVAFLGGLVLSLAVYVKHRSEFSPDRIVCFFTLMLFFLPMFLSNNVNVAFFSYAIAHGMQYLTFMAVLSIDLGVRDGRRAVSAPMIAVAASLVLLGLVGAHASGVKGIEAVASSPVLTGIVDFLAGIILGTTVAHFVIDAGAWKLSRPSARRYVTERFGFLFDRVPTPARAASRVCSP